MLISDEHGTTEAAVASSGCGFVTSRTGLAAQTTVPDIKTESAGDSVTMTRGAGSTS